MDTSTISSKSKNDSFYSKETTNTDLDTSVTKSESLSISKASKIISDMYLKIVTNNQKVKERLIRKDLFYSPYIPSISIEDYISRLVKFTQVETSTLIISLLYLDKITKNKDIILCQKNIHRFILASIVLSAKFNEERHLKNSSYAKIGGISKEEMMNLELSFMDYINNRFFVDENEYEKYENVIKNSLLNYESEFEEK